MSSSVDRRCVTFTTTSSRASAALTLGGVDAVDVEGDDAALQCALVAHGHTVDIVEALAQPSSEVLDAGPRRIETDVQRIASGDAEPDTGGDVALVVLEASSIGS